MAKRAVRRRSKYGAIPTKVDGIRFASKREAKRYGELKLLEKAGEIESLALQMKFPIYVYDSTGESYMSRVFVCDYLADFSYWDTRKKRGVVEDVKGFKTPVYRLKKKLVEAQYGFKIVEV